MPLLQGGKRTLYAGSWTVANTHEVAVISGLAAAWRLGARYPFEPDEMARSQFDTYLRVAHGIGHVFSRAELPRGSQLVGAPLCGERVRKTHTGGAPWQDG